MKKISKKIVFILIIICIGFMNVNAQQNGNLSIENVGVSQLIRPLTYQKFENTNVLCTGSFGDFLKQIFHFIKIVIPILIIVLSIVDFVKAMLAQKQDEIKAAVSKFGKRLIIGAIIFVLPTLIDFLLNIAQISSETCGW